jgi:glutamate/tyrosine decarboxylase-like PLP-dependent enzyme
MNKIWKKRSHEEIKSRVFKALNENINYDEQNTLGVPASYLDDKIFNQNASFLKDAPFVSTLAQNPNHIGCHTVGESESFFKGTQEIEKELVEICSVDILKAKINNTDGYVASGGTEANIQAMWVYRNYFIHQFSAKREEICIICSEDSHYSMDKGANLLVLDLYKIKVQEENREVTSEQVNRTISEARENGKKYFIVICNMMTTMFGSVDKVDIFTDVLAKLNCEYKLHIDGAYGGFYYPFANDNSKLTFENPNISSFTLDAHKMAQAPYGTGIFLIRKGLIHHVNTKEASYVEGEDLTLIGSRSGANAIAVWMILSKNGPFGWYEKIFILQKRTDWMVEQLEKLEIGFYRQPYSNIITIKSEFIAPEIASTFGLVPDSHANPKWFKIVIMEHVTIEKLDLLIKKIREVNSCVNLK